MPAAAARSAALEFGHFARWLLEPVPDLERQIVARDEVVVLIHHVAILTVLQPALLLQQCR